MTLGKVEGGGAQRGAALGVASVAIGLLTTFSGAGIDVASGLLADLRQGICIVRTPGDSSSVWGALLDGGWRPYDRSRCCGGADSVDRSTQECRATAIIKRSARKRLAMPVKNVVSFSDGHVLHQVESQPAAVPSATSSSSTPPSSSPSSSSSSASSTSQHHSSSPIAVASHLHGTGPVAFSQTNQTPHDAAHRMESLGLSVLADAVDVRRHISETFGTLSASGSQSSEESTSSVAARDMSLMSSGLTLEAEEAGQQTLTESAGGTDPVFEWVPWSRVLFNRGHHSLPCIVYVLGAAFLGLLAALVTLWAPAARGSGIPEVKASFAGFDVSSSFQFRTLLAKMVALSLCVGAGLAVGKEGPMIHIGACWGMILAQLAAGRRFGVFPGLSDVLKETDLTCMGAAAGVSAAFGAPLGGVLFSIEELGTTSPTGLRYSTMLCTLVSAVVAALALKWLDLTKTQRVTLFEVEYKQAWAPWEAIPFCVLGVIGGVLGGAFVKANESVHRARLVAESSGRPCWFCPRAWDSQLSGLLRKISMDGRVLEIVVLAALSALTNFQHGITRMSQNDAIRSLFGRCEAHRMDPAGLCNDTDAGATLDLFRLLLGVATLRFLQTAATFGAMTPAGLFVPSLCIGGLLGRLLGSILNAAGLAGAAGMPVEPGIYAMVGAGAMLAGVSRLTLSLAVVLFELTGGLTYVVPFLLAVLAAKWTGDLMTEGNSVYDIHGELRGFTKVEPSNQLRIMNASLEDVDRDPSPSFKGKAVAVRSDCLLLTAYCIFSNHPQVEGLSVRGTGPDGIRRYVSREHFYQQLVSRPFTLVPVLHKSISGIHSQTKEDPILR